MAAQRGPMKVGVIIQIDEYYQGAGPVPAYATMRALARQAEEAGFNSLWLADHLLYRPDATTPWMTQAQGVWECWTMLAALAEATTRVALGTWVLCTQFRNPAVLAKMAVTLDEVSGGRLILGLGAGWHRPEFDAFGVPWEHKVDRFEEAVQIITALLREGRVDVQGRYYRAVQCELAPRGPRPHGPPLLIGAKQPRMLRLAARYADSWNHAGPYSAFPTSRAAVLAGVDRACAAVGRNLATLEVTASLRAAYPAAGPLSARWTKEASAPGEVAAQLQAYEALGVGHVFCECLPATPAALACLTDELHLYRSR